MSDPLFSEKQKGLVKNFLVGGLLGGLTTGGAASLLNSYREKKRRARPDTSADDGVLYVDVPDKGDKKSASATSSREPGPGSSALDDSQRAEQVDYSAFFSPEDAALPQMDGLIKAMDKAMKSGLPATTEVIRGLQEAQRKIASDLGGLLAPGLALGGGGILWLEAHKALTKAYKKHKLSEVQKELDAAQHLDVGSIQDEVAGDAKKEEKVAGDEAEKSEPPISGRQFLASGLPVGLGTLMAYAAHSISRKALGKMFPGVKTNKSPKPTRVVVRSATGQKDVEVPEDEKAAALREFLLDMATGYDEAAGHIYGIAGLTKAAANGESGVVIKLLEDGDEEALDKLAAAYSDADVNPRDRRAALRLLSAYPTVAPALEIKTAGILASSSRPFEAMVKGASEVDAGFDDDMEELALNYVRLARASAFGPAVEKTASESIPTSPVELLSLLMDARRGREGRQADGGQTDDVLGSTSRRSDEADSPVLTVGDAAARMRRRTKPNKDVVDAILEATAKSPAAV